MADSEAPGDPFDFRPRSPGPPLDRHVAMIWYARGNIAHAREKIAPTGSTVAVFVLGDAIVQTPDDGRGRPLRAERGFLVGPHDRPVVNEPLGETFAIGIVSTPIGCEALFGIRPAAIRGCAVDLESVWPEATALRRRLVGCTEPESMLDALTVHLRSAQRPSAPGVARCAKAVAMLDADPARAVADIAAELGVSHGHLDRELVRIVGLTPRMLAALFRVRRLLAALDIAVDQDWAALAAEHGWFDQAHLIRDFKRYTGVTPERYVAAQRRHFTRRQAHDALGFVPER